eukprot:gene8842-biopygen13703
MCRNTVPEAPLGEKSEGMQHRKCRRNRGSHKCDALMMNQGISDNAQIRHLENDPGHNSWNERGLVHPLCNMYQTASVVYHDPVLFFFVVLQAQPGQRKMEQENAPGARKRAGKLVSGMFCKVGRPKSIFFRFVIVHPAAAEAPEGGRRASLPWKLHQYSAQEHTLEE